MTSNVFQNWDQFWLAVLNVIAPIVLTAIGLLIKNAFVYIAAKTSSVKNDQVRTGLQAAEYETEHLVNTIVASLNQTVVGALKAKQGGTLTIADAKAIKNQAVTSVASLLSDEARSILIDHRTDLQSYIGHLIESAVARYNSYAYHPLAAPITPVSPDPAPVTPVTPVTPAAPVSDVPASQ